MNGQITMENDSTNVTENNFQMAKPDTNIGKKFLAKKRKFSEEDRLILIGEEVKETIEIPFKKAFLFNFLELEDICLLSEDEIIFENDERYFIKNSKKESGLFKVINPKIALFKKAKENSLQAYLTGIDFSKKIRSSKTLPNFKQKHYIRVSIKRNFMNNYLLIALDKKLEEAGFNISFEKFPQSIAVNVAKDFNNNLMNMKLKDIFKNEDLYNIEDRTNFELNLKIVDKIEKEGNPELNMILNRKFRCLFEEYLNSEEFGIDEINRLKNSKVEKDEYYIEKYIFLAQHFIEFCTQ
jgi:hypothetical protein